MMPNDVRWISRQTQYKTLNKYLTLSKALHNSNPLDTNSDHCESRVDIQNVFILTLQNKIKKQLCFIVKLLSFEILRYSCNCDERSRHSNR